MPKALDQVELELTVNGELVRLKVPPFATLLDVLRNDLELTGTKYGCGEGECGACSVLLDGKLVNSCLFRQKKTPLRNIWFLSLIRNGRN